MLGRNSAVLMDVLGGGRLRPELVACSPFSRMQWVPSRDSREKLKKKLNARENACYGEAQATHKLEVSLRELARSRVVLTRRFTGGGIPSASALQGHH
jgi:hypothetical protein